MTDVEGLARRHGLPAPSPELRERVLRVAASARPTAADLWDRIWYSSTVRLGTAGLAAAALLCAYFDDVHLRRRLTAAGVLAPTTEVEVRVAVTPGVRHAFERLGEEVLR